MEISCGFSFIFLYLVLSKNFSLMTPVLLHNSQLTLRDCDIQLIQINIYIPEQFKTIMTCKHKCLVALKYRELISIYCRDEPSF